MLLSPNVGLLSWVINDNSETNIAGLLRLGVENYIIIIIIIINTTATATIIIINNNKSS